MWPCSRWLTDSSNCSGIQVAYTPMKRQCASLIQAAGRPSIAYLWAYRPNVLDEGPPLVVFNCQPSRAGAHARASPQERRGDLMVDNYAGCKALFTAGTTELVCLAHIRRKFFDVHAASVSAVAEGASRRIAQLYAVE